MPLGSELAEIIEQLLDEDLRHRHEGPISRAIMRDGGLEETHQAAMRRIREGISSCDSIDEFISEWRDIPHLEHVAKVTIAQVLLDREKRSLLGEASSSGNHAPALRELKSSWIGYLSGRLKRGQVPRRNVRRVYEGVSFITFNYDRLIEQYLLASFTTNFALSDTDARAALSSIPVLHAYGTLGDLGSASPHVPFGGNEYCVAFAARNIATYTEDAPTERVEAIREKIHSADKIIFLGCAYHSQNLDILFGENRHRVKAPIWGTAVAMPARQLRRANEELRQVSSSVELHDLSCREFLGKLEDALF